jgi:maltose alpha-D-glucosyltransferase / alpha-amylase
MTELDDQLHWYKDAIIYELHIKAFRDSNGDGIGDFRGLMEKLDYLQELGVTAIWLLPFYPSPLKDDGYDIADYYNINPSFGNIEDLKKLLEEAHKRNLKVITELVINHTSDQHPWFQRARRAPAGSAERDFYVWTDDPNKYKDVRIIFQDFEASNWTWDPVAQQYFWHRFFHHQPDLNFENPIVQEEVFRVLDHWCAMGVDGFRLDAVPYLFEREGTNGENLPETHAFLKKLRAHIDEKFPGTVFLAEANMWPEDSASYFGNGDECHMNYHFPVMPRMFMALQREDRYPITDIFDQTPAIPDNCQWAIFLRNHDELTLEMVTDEERDYMYKVYAKDPKARINLGIRHRLAPLMDNDRRKIELMNSLLFSLPGTPVIYYGDEIGMGDNFYLGDRDGVRTPMQWSPDRNAGFSSANPQSLYLPVIIDPEYNFEAVNVELQRRNTSSLFWYMKRIINMRKKHKAFGRGDMHFIQVDNPKVLAFTRRYKEDILLVVVNLSKHSQAAEIDLHEFADYEPVEVFSQNSFPAIKSVPYFFTLGGHSFQWFELLQKKTETVHPDRLPEFELHSIHNLLEDPSKNLLEQKILPGYFKRADWFGGKTKKIFSISILQHEALHLPSETVFLLLVEVSYESGLPDFYQLPLTLAKDQLEKKLKESCPQSFIAHIRNSQGGGVLCDALYTPEFQHWLFLNLAGNNVITLKSSVLHFTANDALKDFLNEHGKIRSRVHATDYKNTSITYENNFFLKMFRKMDAGINPDIELTQHLTEDTDFTNIPAFLGSINWMLEKDTLSLGMMQVMVENHGDGKTYMTERLQNFIERILAMEKPPDLEMKGSLVHPVPYDQLPTELQVLLGGPASEQAALLGSRIAKLHASLSANQADKRFESEEFSLHYQRSLFSSLQSLVRETFQNVEKNIGAVQEKDQQELRSWLEKKEPLLNILKKIYAKKLDVQKIRIHGNLHLDQILLTGKDIAIHDFGGDPHLNFSERRLKRSPLRDVASMVRSFYYLAHEAIMNTTHVPKDDIPRLMAYAPLWAHYMSGFFTHAYFKQQGQKRLLPDSDEDLEMMLETFLIQKALQALNGEIIKRPGHAFIPLKILEQTLGKSI